MPDIEGYDEAMSLNKAQTAEVASQLKVLHDRAMTLSKERASYDRERSEALTDAEIMASDDLKRWLCRAESDYDQGDWSSRTGNAPYGRYCRLTEGYEHLLSVSSRDGRDEYHALPTPTIGLWRGQDVTPVIEALHTWARDWALGRTTMPIEVMEHTLSAGASYGISEWNLDTDRMTFGSHRQELIEGPAAEVLAYIAKRHPLRNEEGRPIPDYEEDYGRY